MAPDTSRILQWVLDGKTEEEVKVLANADPGVIAAVNTIDENDGRDKGTTVLMRMTCDDFAVGVRVLLSIPGIDVNIRSGWNPNRSKIGYTALMHAAYLGKEESLGILLAVPVIDVNVKGLDDGNSAITLAAKRQDAEPIKMLLARSDIDVNAKNHKGDTALMIATEEQNLEVVEALLKDPRVNVNASNVLGETALMLLAKKVRSDLDSNVVLYPQNSFAEQIARLLTQHPDIDIIIRNNDGKTALQLAGEGPIGVVLSDAVDRIRMASRSGHKVEIAEVGTAKPGPVATGEPEVGAPKAKVPDLRDRTGS